MSAMFILFFIGLIFHIIAVITDLQTGEVPQMISFSYVITSAIYMQLYNGDKMLECLIAGMIISLLLSIFVFKANLGGADVIYLAGSALFYGYIALYEVLVAFALSLPYAVYMRVKKDEHSYPFMPYVMTGYIVTFFIHFSTQNY